MMKLYLFAGYHGAGKTTSVNLLKSYFEQQGLRVCTFQRSKNFYDICMYSEDHFILPPAAFANITELEKWLPVGYDVAIMEYVIYENFNTTGFSDRYIECIPESQVNEIIISGNPAPERETNIVYSKTDYPMDRSCCFLTDFSVSRIENLVYLNVNPKWICPTYPDIHPVFVGTIPPEWYIVFPNYTRRGKELFLKDCHYDLSIIGAAENLKKISDSLPDDLRCVCLYPPAFNPSCQPYNHRVNEMHSALQESEYPDHWYNAFTVAPSISITENQVLFNGIPPIRFILDQGWLSQVI